jgi:hypothetical protein
MAKAVVPFAAFQAKFGTVDAAAITGKLLELALQFLRELQVPEKKKDTVRA